LKQDKADKIIQKAERKAAKAAQQVELAGKKAEAAKQKQAAKAEKKAAQMAKAAEQKAAKHTKKAEQATKKAQLAAQKAQEKKAKAAAKTAAKAVEGEEGEAAEGGKKKKKGKKKLLMILIPVLAAAIGVGAFFFLKGGGEEEEAPPEPIPIPLEYVLNEIPITALPVRGDDVLVYQEEVPPEPPAEPEEPETDEKKEDGEKEDEKKEDGEEGNSGEDGGEKEKEAPAAEEPEGFTKILYRYEGLKNPVSLISAYAAVMSTEDAGFSVVDETLLRIDPPEEYGARGSIQLARNVPKAEDGTGGGVHSMLLSWEGTNCSVLLDMPEGRVHDPKAETAAPGVTRWGLSDLEALHPSKLGLPGESMEAYEIIPQEGSVRIANSICMRVNIYGESHQIAGSYFLSTDGKLYKLDESVNKVVELDWE